MKATYSMMALAVLAFAACDDESYDDWAQPQSNAQEAAQTIGLSVAATGTVDFATLGDDDEALVKVFTPTLQSPAAKTKYTILFSDGKTIEADSVGQVKAGELKEAVVAQFGRAPEKRTLSSTVVALVDVDGVTTKVTSPVSIEAQLVAPVIETAYYYVGSANGWSSTDKTYAFKRADDTKSVYDDPIFTVTIPASFDAEDPTKRVDEWFKIAPASAYEVSSDDFWGHLLGAEVNGCSDLQASLVTTDPQAFSQPATDGALYYTLTLNMMDYTITVAPLAFEEYLFVPGNPSWSPETAAALRSADADGVYTGYAYLDGEFKFTKHRNWGDGEYNANSFTTYATGIAPAAPGTDNTNIKAETAGLYLLTIDVANGTFDASLTTTWGIVGPAQDGGWDADTDMTWSSEENAYVYTGALKAGEFKFRANDDWGINLGGTLDDLEGNGANLSIASDGNYTVKLYPCRNASEKIYCTVTAN